MEEYNFQEDYLIQQIVPKIDIFFTKNQILNKSNLKEFILILNSPNLVGNDNLESFWEEISKNSKDNNLSKELVTKNIKEYIHNHSEEIFQKKTSFKDSVAKFIQRPVKLIEDIDVDNELMFEFYLLLATLEFTNSQDVSLSSIENALSEYKFINLTKDAINDLLQELLQEKEKIESFKKYYYLEIMEKMSIEYNEYQLEKISLRKINFSEKDLERPELKDFINLDTFVKILKIISDSVLICHQKNIEDIKNNDLNRNFLVLVNNMKLYFYEILRIYNEQRQKFDHFVSLNDSKITILKQQNKDLEIQLREKYNDKILNDLYDEIKALNGEINSEKDKNDVLSKENQKLKQEISNTTNQIYENELTIQEMQRIQKENEGKIISLNKEKELQSKTYKKIHDELNTYLLKEMQKKEELNKAVEKMNLDNNLRYLVNMEKADIIDSFNKKYKDFISIDKDNKYLKNKINELEKSRQKNEEEIDDLKEKNNSLNKKNEILQKEIENSKKENNDQDEDGFSLNNLIDDKVDKEDYDQLEYLLNEEKEKNAKMKKNIDELNEKISQKEEDIIRSKNKINSQENLIKENEKQINNLKEELNKTNDKYNELQNKYEIMMTKIEEDERKLKNSIENLNLSEKYQQLINKEKIELIKLIIDKDSFINKIEEENSGNKNEIKDLNNLKQELNEEINKNKITINNLNKKIINLENELKEINSEKSKLHKIINEKDEELKKEKEEKENLDKNLLNEKNKNELLFQENNNLKNEIITHKENISKIDNELSLLKNKFKEKEEQINSLTKEKEILNANYKVLLDKYNEQLAQLANTKQKEEITSIAIQNLNLTGDYIKLANMSTDQLISLIIEKDKYLKIIEDLNKELNEKIEKINKEKNSLEEECNKLKLNIVNLEKNNSLSNQEKENLNKDLEKIKIEKNNLISDLQKEKTLKENYIKEVETLKEEIKELNYKINILKIDNQKLIDENNSKDEIITKLENNISSMETKINDIEKQNSDLSSKNKELTDKLNIEIEKIKNLDLKEKSELDSISKLNLSNEYQFLSNKNKAYLISLIIEKDNLNQKLHKEKNELINKISDLEKNKIELEKNMADFEAKNNTLNNKIKNLDNEINSIKKENENLIKEKTELNNLLKEEKKLLEKMKYSNDLLNKENTKIDILTKENKKLSEEIKNQKDTIDKIKNELLEKEKNLEEKENINNNLTKEIDSLNSQYNFLLNKYNNQNLILQNKEKAKEEALKNIEEKYNYLKDLPIEELIKIIIEKDKVDINYQEDIKNIKAENSNLKQRIEEYLNKYNESKNENQKLINERDDYKNKYNKLLEDIVKQNKERKIFKNNLLAIITNTQFNLKKQIKKDNKNRNYQEEKNYDYLCLRTEMKIVSNFKDSVYDGKTVFTESIKFVIDQKKNTCNSIVFITMEYFYLFSENYKLAFSQPLSELSLFYISETSNYVSLIFQRTENIVFETFRVLELVNFMKLIQARKKSLLFQIISEPYLYIQPKEKIKKNYIESLYYGKAYFSGSFIKQFKGVFKKEGERFGVLCEIGLIILDSPTGEPKEIINLMFAEISRFNTKEGNNGLSIFVKDSIHKLVFDNDKIRNEWESKINTWKKNNEVLTKF